MKLAFALCVLSAPLAAQTAAVKSAQTAAVNVQGLVDFAEPGSVVRLYGGHAPVLVIDKPITIVSEPRTRIDRIALRGTGEGEVTLANLATTDIFGFGFPVVHLHDVEVTGVLKPQGARYVELSRCNVGTINGNGHDIVAPGSVMVLLDVQFASGSCRVVAGQLYRSIGCSPNRGSSLINSEHVLADDLMLVGEVQIGKRFMLTWNTPGPRGLLLGAIGTRRPVPIPGWTGFWHLDQTAMILTGLPAGGGPRTMGTWVPARVDLIGAKIVVQLMDPPNHMSRPAVAVVRP